MPWSFASRSSALRDCVISETWAARGRFIAIRPAGAPEAQQPGRDVERIGRRDGQRPERVEQPFGALRMTPGVASGATSVKANAPALPCDVAEATPVAVKDRHIMPAHGQLQACGDGRMTPAPMIAIFMNAYC